MAYRKYYTFEELEKAKAVLEELPDLKKTRLNKETLLENLKSHIMKLSLNKGYSSSEIKSALQSIEIKVTLKDIQKMISTKRQKK